MTLPITCCTSLYETPYETIYVCTLFHCVVSVNSHLCFVIYSLMSMPARELPSTARRISSTLTNFYVEVEK